MAGFKGVTMYNPWFDSTLLAMQSGSVVYMRLLKMAIGGPDAHAESERMVSEKLMANTTAAMTLMTGGSVETVIAGYRKIVDANVDRLLAPGQPAAA